MIFCTTPRLAVVTIVSSVVETSPFGRNSRVLSVTWRPAVGASTTSCSVSSAKRYRSVGGVAVSTSKWISRDGFRFCTPGVGSAGAPCAGESLNELPMLRGGDRARCELDEDRSQDDRGRGLVL